MITFLNFAPLSFGGGVERWIVSVAESIKPREEVSAIEVDRPIANLYAELVFKRKFDERMHVSAKDLPQDFITWNALVPFSSSWFRIRRQIKNSRLIYTKFEVNETLLLMYFAGFSTIRKTIIGLHSPFLYSHAQMNFFERLHNIVYSSFLSKYVLSQAYKVHVLSPDQERKLVTDFGLKNVVRIPNYIENEGPINRETKKGALRVCFIGELNKRKGADILLEIMKKSSGDFSFEIAGDGPLKEKFTQLNLQQAHYHGYLSQKEVSNLINSCDVLLMPSRAESFSLVSLEALSDGLVVICSSTISPNELEKYLIINGSNTTKEYNDLLENLYLEKQNGKLKQKRSLTAQEIRKRYSKKTLIHQLQTELFNERKI